MKSERFALLERARFYNLFELRHGPDHGERETNGNKLRDAGKSVFQDIRDCESNNASITTKARRKIPENFVFFVPSW
ncbi:hypothetical protein B0F87_106207 [Methylobacter tundripaludum]|uniref:Uncharacterized protein n=1 Tax=Methylobacter tundripaludum TaxID=173365 RepID=A0A2S6HCZ1_9GAMM|nr:hypothetical protein [Methylobacter tundripaludum]PPK75359.1 hypothetical protein B0F87_106207 [Methylobacter tundripaludum]